MKNSKGFTLVEAIVVSIIMLVLASVSIPMYSGFIKNAKIDSAKSVCQLIGAGIIQTHNRGIDIGANNWSDIGINNPEDDTWKYSFAELSGSVVIPSGYAILAKNSKIGTITFYPAKSGSDRWSLP